MQSVEPALVVRVAFEVEVLHGDLGTNGSRQFLAHIVGRHLLIINETQYRVLHLLIKQGKLERGV